MPTIFISHRHTDRQIADVISNHLQLWGIGENAIYQFSAATGTSSGIGEYLTQHLRDALHRANIVILVYTFADHDWSYCMWECGVATDPQLLSTRIVVFQTTADIPTVFADQIRIRINQQDIFSFTRQFHTEQGFFPGEPAFAPNVNEGILRQKSTAFYNDLNSVIPERQPAEQPQQRYRWDCFKLKLNLDSLRKINHPEASQDTKINIIQQESKVTWDFGEALKHFGYVPGVLGLTFSQLVIRWKETTSLRENIPQEWIAELCEEMLRAIQDKPAVPTWELMKSNHYPDWWFYPVVNHAIISPDGSIEFQIYMYRFPGSLPNNPT